jgi:hypothetical protein
VLVVWEVEDNKVIEQAKSVYGIEVWKISDVLSEMMNKIGTKSYRDDALRIVQLITKMKA